jgi:cyclin-dependent kinase 12/13
MIVSLMIIFTALFVFVRGDESIPDNTEHGGEIPKNVFMVFEYLEYDLTGILETPEIRLTQDHIKSWSQQLLRGVHYMHTNKVIHRDLKASNILVNKRGELKIADWGLARSWNSNLVRMTNPVITLWYRPPELLLGYVVYTGKVDMWSVGCIIAEMFRRTGFLRGDREATQLDLIFRTCGHPTAENWPDLPKKGRLWKNFEPAPGEPRFPRRIREALKVQLPHPKWMTESAIDLIDKLMILDPEKRWSAEEALDADYFFENPIVKPASKLSMRFAVDSVHEWQCRKKHEKIMAQRKAQLSANVARPPLPPSGPPAKQAPPPPPPPRA